MSSWQSNNLRQWKESNICWVSTVYQAHFLFIHSLYGNVERNKHQELLPLHRRRGSDWLGILLKLLQLIRRGFWSQTQVDLMPKPISSLGHRASQMTSWSPEGTHPNGHGFGHALEQIGELRLRLQGPRLHFRLRAWFLAAGSVGHRQQVNNMTTVTTPHQHRFPPPACFLISCYLFSSLISFPLGRFNLHLNRITPEWLWYNVKVLITNSFLFKY